MACRPDGNGWLAGQMAMAGHHTGQLATADRPDKGEAVRLDTKSAIHLELEQQRNATLLLARTDLPGRRSRGRRCSYGKHASRWPGEEG